MPIEVAILLIILAAFLAVVLTRAHLQKQGEQSEAWRWANHSTPLIIEQYNSSDRAALVARQEYENTIAKLKEHGNKYLLFKDAKGEVFSPYVQVWIWKTDTNTKTDFEAWKYENVSRTVKLWEEFFRAKAENAKRNGQEAEAARFFAMSESAADFVRNQNGQL